MRCLLTTLALLAATCAHALDPARWISQYSHTSWTLQEGFFPGAPTKIAQTADGYLWIGTRAGMLRFDGVRFTPLELPGGEQLLSSRILALHAGSDGSLWIGTRSDLEHWHDGQLTHYPDALGSVMAIHEDPSRHIWFVRNRIKSGKGALCEVVDTRTRCFGVEDGFSESRSRDLVADDASGGLWVISDTDLVRWPRPGTHETFVPAGLTNDNALDAFNSIIHAADGSLWIGAAQPGRDLGLVRFSAGEWQPVIVPGFDGRKISVSSLLRDRENSVWVGTQNDGLYRLSPGRSAHYAARDGLSSDTIEALFEDREGNLWVLTPKGVDVFRDVRIPSISTHEGLDADLANGVLATHDGTVWIDTWHSLVELRGDKIEVLNRATGVPGEEPTAMFEDREGRLWIGVDHELTVYEHGKFKALKKPDGKPAGTVESIAQDSSGDVWVAAFDESGERLLRFRNTKPIEEVPESVVPYARARALAADANDGIWVALRNGDLGHYHQGRLDIVEFHRAPTTGLIWSILALPDGSIVGGTSAGLIGWRAGRKLTMTAANGLPCEEIHALLMDRHRDLWIYAACGLVSISHDELQRWWSDTNAHVHARLFDAYDGVQPALANFFPRASAAPDGKLWFANASVVQVVDPDHLIRNTLAPPVHIERVIANHRAYSSQSALALPPNTRDLQVDYTALSFVAPQKVLFRYRLEGHDNEWREAGTRRQAFYTDLPPGRYRFRVIASNNDGVWNETGASLDLSIPPMLYQTWWFAILVIGVGIALVGLLVAWRMRLVNVRLRGRLEERMIERERIARELHDTFLQSVQGLVLQFQSAMEKIPPTEPARGAMERALERADDVLAEGRERVADLRTPDEPRVDLPHALQAVAEQDAALHGIAFRFSVAGNPRPVHPVTREEIEQILREALTNAFRHSRAQSVDLDLTYSSSALSARVADDGIGFDTVLPNGKGQHFGLVGMRERARKINARLEISSRPGAGTTVELRVPASTAFQAT